MIFADIFITIKNFFKKALTFTLLCVKLVKKFEYIKENINIG